MITRRGPLPPLIDRRAMLDLLAVEELDIQPESRRWALLVFRRLVARYLRAAPGSLVERDAERSLDSDWARWVAIQAGLDGAEILGRARAIKESLVDHDRRTGADVA